MRERKISARRGFFLALAFLSLIGGLSIFFFVHRGLLRDYGGDVVAVTFLYSVLRLTLRPKPITTATVVFAVAVIIEILQAMASLPHSTVSTLALGSTFDLADIIIYFVTTVICYSLDRGLRSPSSASMS